MSDLSGANPPPEHHNEHKETVLPLTSEAEQSVCEMGMNLPWPETSMQSILDRLCGGSLVKSVEGIYRTRSLPAEPRYQIIKQLFWLYDHQVMEKPNKAYIWLLPVFGSCGSLMFLAILPWLYPFILTLLFTGSSLYIWDQRRRRNTTRHNLETLLQETEDVRLLPIALTFPRSGKGQAIAVEECLRVRTILLRRLLPLVTEEYTRVWTPEQTAMTMHLLKTPYRDGELTLALLRVAAFIGNNETLHLVERLVKNSEPRSMLQLPIARDHQSYEHYNDRIHAAALLCREKLKARLRPMEQAATLLRASASPGVSSMELLRAVTPDGGLTPQGELLRAYSPPTDAEIELTHDTAPPSVEVEEIQQIQWNQRELG